MNLNDNNYELSPMAYSGTLEEQIDEDAADDFMNYQPESKKRRLSVEQVRSLEKSFELETKLEPEKKIQLAQELGLQPRQVAVWFQNRRARWKTKQLEKDYGVLKLNYDALKSNYEGLQQEKENLLAELESLKAKLDAVEFCRVENTKEIELTKKEASTIGSTNKVAVDVAGGDNSIDIKPFSDFTLLIKEKEYIGPDMVDIKPVRLLLLNEKDIGSVNSEGDSGGHLNKDVKSSNQILTQFAQATTPMKYPPANNNITGGDSTHDQGLMQLAEALCGIGIPPKAYQQLFRIDESYIQEEACNFFVNMEDPGGAASTLPWWEY